MRFEVPQFIEIEDKIFGPLTWKQFIYLAGGTGFGVVALFVLPFFLFVFLAIPIGALAGALAFYPVNNRPFSIFLESIYQYFKNNRLYLWRRRGEFKSPEHATTSQSMFSDSNTLFTPPQSQNRLSSLSRQLELNALEIKD